MAFDSYSRREIAILDTNLFGAEHPEAGSGDVACFGVEVPCQDGR